MHSYYESLITAGFKEEQALHLVSKHGIMPPPYFQQKE